MKATNKRVVALLAAGALVAIGSIALADTKTIQDPSDTGNNGGIDIKTASHGHTPTGLLKHKITTYDQIADMEQACLFIKTSSGAYETCGYRMYDSAGNETGVVTEKRPDNRTIIFKFKKSAIERPGSYTWIVKAGNYCQVCDRAPNSGRVRHTL